jgi:hypothetical protein
MNGFNKIVLLLLTAILISCGNKEFRILQTDIKERGNINCKNHLQTQYESIYGLIHHKESLMLLKHSNFWSEIDKNKINKKYRIPHRYSHWYKLTNSKWVNYKFHLLSNKNYECNTTLDYYKSINEKLNIYEELLVNNDKIKYIEEIGHLVFNNDFRLIIFGEEDLPENVTILENRILVPKSALDWKYRKYGFLLTSTNNNEEPLIYHNKAILIDLNNLEILGEITPLL